MSAATKPGAAIPPLKSKRKPKPVPCDSFRPWPCVTLCSDPGERCGVSVFRVGSYVDSGFGDGFDAAFMTRWIGHAAIFARALSLPLVLVLEQPPKGGRPYEGRGPLGVASVIGSRKVWLHTWKHSAITRTKLRCNVYPVTWRARVLGITPGDGLERAEFLRAMHLARKPLISRDEAAAILIGEWSCRAGVVGALLS